jgi:HK97 family phage major capsid protein
MGKKLVKAMGPHTRRFLENHGLAKEATIDDARLFARTEVVALRMNKQALKAAQKRDAAGDQSPPGPSPAKLFGGGSDDPRIRVKDVSERFSNEKKVLKHAKTGQLVKHPDTGRPCESTSQLELAKCGAWMHFLAQKAGVPCRPLEDYEMALLQESALNDEWVGNPGGSLAEESQRRLAPSLVQKTLLSDSTSGGISINPLWFDTAIVTFPLLSGELTPYVEMMDMPRGSLINTASLQNVTVTWGQPEGTSVTMFNTSSLIAAISGTVQNVMVAVEVGRDLMADAAVDIGSYLVRIIGERFQAELDRVIANGNGTTEPQGIFNSSNLTYYNSDYGPSGPLSLSDFEGLAFGSPKQYRKRELNPCYCMSDVSYRRARAVPIGPGDERRVFGMDQQSYTLFDWPVRVQQNIPNNQIAFLPMRKYRLWRRLGYELRWTLEGQYLALRNTALLVARARYFGKVMDPTGVVVMLDTAA